MAFLGVALVVIVAPGPDTALTVRNTLVRGRAGGLATALGVVSSQLAWGLAAAAGVTALLVASRPAFVALRLAGAAYLVWLGISSLVAAWRHRPAAWRTTQRGSAYRQGLLSNLSNPKMALFFTSLLPQFGASFATLAWHGAAFAALTLLWLSVVACAGSAFRVPAVRRTIDAIAGVVLIAFGLRLTTEGR